MKTDPNKSKKAVSAGSVSPSPHGGCGLINRFVEESERQPVLKIASHGIAYNISDADLATFCRIADGTLSPLEGPMTKAEFERVLSEETIERNGKKYAWTIPVVFPIAGDEAKKLEIGRTIIVNDERNVAVGILEISDIYEFDKIRYNRIVYGTDRRDHPGPRIINSDGRTHLLGGRITAFPAMPNPVYGRYLMPPKEARELFKSREWQRIVAFQTRNPLHRAHEYAMVHAMERLTREGFYTGVVVNPLVGQTKSDDIPADVRMKTYETLLINRLIGKGDMDADLWKAKKHSLADNLLLVGLDIRMFYAGPKEAVMHAIYRQNIGFTDIIIGRKHADAPFDDNESAWGDFEAQEKFDKLKGELLIRPLKVGFAAYFEELGRVGLVDEFKPRGFTEVSISGKELRRKLQNKEPIDERIMRPEVAAILSDAYQHNIAELRDGIKSKNITWHESGISKPDRERSNGHKGACIWLTGLSCAGKSTVAVELQKVLFKNGCQVFVLDGDNIRHGLNRDLGFSPEDRIENIRRIGEVAKLFVEAGFLVITAFISPYRKDRENVRSILKEGEFVEVFVRAALAVCEERDTKGLYKKARIGEIKEFTGISAPYEEPLSAEITLDTDAHTKEECAMKIADYLSKNAYIRPGRDFKGLLKI